MGHDLVIRNGLIADGSGGTSFFGDIAIRDGWIVEIGRVEGDGAEEIDAEGCSVTPGFVDIHTHYDAQVTWSDSLAPSVSHGVTTVIFGNCGVGFAPCRPEDRQKLLQLMEGVEDIPEVVMAEGIPWEWESFPDFLTFLEKRRYDIDIGAYVPHAPLRLYVMGDRAMRLEAATESDIAAMAELTREAIHAGAVGFGTSGSINHRSRAGDPIFTRDASERELTAIAGALSTAGTGIMQVIYDLPESEEAERRFDILCRIAASSGRPLCFTLAQQHSAPTAWRRILDRLGDARAAGIDIKGQVFPRPIGVVMGHDLTCNPFSTTPTYCSLATLSAPERLGALRNPDIRARIIAEARASEADYMVNAAVSQVTDFDNMFALRDPPDYNQGSANSIGAIARTAGCPPQEIAYDVLLEDEGNRLLFVAFANYAEGNLDAVRQMLTDDNTVVGLGDGGAHYGLICDASFPTSLLCHFGRDAAVEDRIPFELLVRQMTRDTAEAVGLMDRGRLAKGYRADINIIDLPKLKLHPPIVVNDLPAGGRRLEQPADGYVATIVNGVITRRAGVAVGTRPGRLVRGAQPRPAMAPLADAAV